MQAKQSSLHWPRMGLGSSTRVGSEAASHFLAICPQFCPAPPSQNAFHQPLPQPPQTSHANYSPLTPVARWGGWCNSLRPNPLFIGCCECVLWHICNLPGLAQEICANPSGHLGISPVSNANHANSHRYCCLLLRWTTEIRCSILDSLLFWAHPMEIWITHPHVCLLIASHNTHATPSYRLTYVALIDDTTLATEVI